MDELSVEEIQKLIEEECDALKNLLIEKNREYGNSALYPKRIFSKASTAEQLKVRIDDKLSRISNNVDKNIKEDTVMDLAGYLILYKVSNRL